MELLGAGDENGGWDGGWRGADDWGKASRSSNIMRNYAGNIEQRDCITEA